MLSERSVSEQPLDEELRALAAVAAEYRCVDCGYGAMLRRTLPACPMCGGSHWEDWASSPLAGDAAV